MSFLKNIFRTAACIAVAFLVFSLGVELLGVHHYYVKFVGTWGVPCLIVAIGASLLVRRFYLLHFPGRMNEASPRFWAGMAANVTFILVTLIGAANDPVSVNIDPFWFYAITMLALGLTWSGIGYLLRRRNPALQQ